MSVFFHLIVLAARRHKKTTTSVRADSSILAEIHVVWSQNCATEILRCHVYAVSTISEQCNVMSIILDTTGTTYTFYEIEKRKEAKKKTKTKKIHRKRKKKKKTY